MIRSELSKEFAFLSRLPKSHREFITRVCTAVYWCRRRDLLIFQVESQAHANVVEYFEDEFWEGKTVIEIVKNSTPHG
jgi:hypothetical protein